MAARTIKAKSKAKSPKANARASRAKGAKPNTVAGVIALAGAAVGFGFSLLLS